MRKHIQLIFQKDLQNISIKKRLNGVKIAIDPGHFGGQLSELEERFVKIPAAQTNNNQAIYFSEGDLTYLTAVYLKTLLETEGAIVFISRPQIGKGALEEDFFQWQQKHRDFPTENPSKIFRTHYNTEDLKKRAENINQFRPDITLIIHYNAHLNKSEKAEGLLLTQSNYNLAFIPGAFGPDELKKTEDRYEFLRLLLTDCIAESLELSQYITQEFVRHLGVPLITSKDEASYIENACLLQAPGVYCRNLALTRLIRSPLCYGETLVQNNQQEAYVLSENNPSARTNRLQQVARAYFEGIKNYFSAHPLK